ncbi:hypothetical protein GBN32_09875 [Plesiomonas shigelloides]|uniref:hypothetical protein n=1 Tax=Plesiomonas shigelloides TaxID=703 RepID=UPI001262663C|nr:hypothetical protein [Plesiomonas shigelloides]KAB7711023.1 hypothetical protein GBN32_09875 [Plesiomonas shigelloides]
MNIEDLLSSLNKRIITKQIISFSMLLQMLTILIGSAYVAWMFDGLSNQQPRYISLLNEESQRLKYHYSEATRNIQYLLDHKQNSVGIENNLALLTAEVTGLKNSMNGYSKAFNEGKYGILDNHMLGKKILLAIFSMFFLFYLKFLVNMYKYNANMLSHDIALSDSIKLAADKDDNGNYIINLEILKELITVLSPTEHSLSYKDASNNDGIINRLIGKV